MSQNLKGVGASAGIAISKCYILSEPDLSFTKTTISNVEQEISNFSQAIEQCILQLGNIQAIVLEKMGQDKADIFAAHVQIANDPEMIDQIKKMIQDQKVNAAYAVANVYDSTAQIFRQMEDAYFKERASDVIDIKKRMLSILLGKKLPDVMGISEEVIVIAHDLTPSETALLNKKFVKGFITEIGGRTSHAAIMARTLEIPAVVGVKDIMKTANNNEVIAINGDNGKVEIQPNNIDQWQQELVASNKLREQLKKYIHLPTKTLDGHSVMLCANIGKPNDITAALDLGAEGVGLFRSEFLYIDGDHWPTEEEQFVAYKTVLEKADKREIIVRTLDIGGDKTLTYYTFPKEMNPFLGYRAIRFCLDNKDIFKVQLRALLRASIYGNLKIMFPMIATIDEFKQAKDFTLQVAEELKKEGIEIAKHIPIGMMVEIPSSAIHANKFAQYADFFSIGTNDLIQYSFASDRMSEKVSYLYQPNNPALLKLIKMTIDGGHTKKRMVGMCGEMAGDMLSIPILLGLGLDEFSVSATSIAKARMIINSIKYSECQEIAQQAIELDTTEQVNSLIANFLQKKGII